MPLLFILCCYAIFNQFCFTYSTGGSLKNFIKQYGPFRDKEIVDYSFQLLHGVKYLHENNIVHRDIKGIF